MNYLWYLKNWQFHSRNRFKQQAKNNVTCQLSVAAIKWEKREWNTWKWDLHYVWTMLLSWFVFTWGNWDNIVELQCTNIMVAQCAHNIVCISNWLHCINDREKTIMDLWFKCIINQYVHEYCRICDVYIVCENSNFFIMNVLLLDTALPILVLQVSGFPEVLHAMPSSLAKYNCY